jgi:hypothetical protein
VARRGVLSGRQASVCACKRVRMCMLRGCKWAYKVINKIQFTNPRVCVYVCVCLLVSVCARTAVKFAHVSGVHFQLKSTHKPTLQPY